MNEQQPEALAGDEAVPRNGPRIYVASLSDYNNGILHGDWLDATDEPDQLHAGINTMLATSPTTRRYGEPAEEWAIHDYEGFGPLRIGEYTGVERISRLARGIAEHGLAFAAWAAYVGDTEADLLDQFEDRYQGEWRDVEDYADDLLDQLDVDRYISDAPQWLQTYLNIDVKSFAHDLEISGDIIAEESDNGVWIFSGH
jgi:antirestriction protein